MLELQQTFGNQQMMRLLRNRQIQAKLAVNQPGDIFEQEADRVAQQVVSSSVPPLVQRKCACGGAAGASGECEECRKKKEGLVQRKTEGGTESATAPTVVHEVLDSSGQPLDAATRAFLEPRFGHSFEDVRIHTDEQAAEAARSVDALAFTVGRDVVFGAGQYAPGTLNGKRLLAHELTHVVQQRSGGPGETIQRDKDKGKKEKIPAWTVEDLKKMLDLCDGGQGLWAKAKKANGDKDPKVKPGAGGGSATMATGEINITETLDKCNATQQLIQELSNLSRKADFDKLDNSALAGNVARADYIKETEKIEYESGVKNVLAAFDACKDKWGCKTARMEWARKAKGFDDYFDKFLSSAHKENYGKWWDNNCKAAYDKKHPKK
jgi:hypothetical protein